jgi:hypothetical protein
MAALILLKMADSKMGTMLTEIRHWMQVVLHVNPIYYHKEILTTFSVI